jgi:hypothetical protein
MARRNLASLAALGTLGYMLSKKGDKASDKKDEKSTTDAAERRRAADKEASEEPQSMEKDSGMDAEEAANKRTERMLKNPNAREYGEAGTSMTVSPTKKPAASPAKPAVKSRPMSAAAEAAFQESNVSPKTRAEYDMGMGKIARFSPYTTDENQGGVHGGYKRGGSVKKMASGGSVSSASKRADGIATKGKTRGRMC